MQTGKALRGTAVPAAATASAAVVGVVRRQETGAQRWRRSGVGPADRFGGERRGVGHGHRGLLGRQEVGRQRGRVADRRRRTPRTRVAAAAVRRQARRQNVCRPEHAGPHVRHVHLFVAQRSVRQIAIRPLVPVDSPAV